MTSNIHINTENFNPQPQMSAIEEFDPTLMGQVGFFASLVYEANERFNRLAFLQLKKSNFSFDVTDYSNLEIAIIEGNTESFQKEFQPQRTSEAFACAFFFNRTEILVLIYKMAVPEQRLFMRERLLALPEFDGWKNIITYESAQKNPYCKVLEQLDFISRFEKSDDNVQAHMLLSYLHDEKVFCNLWNRAQEPARHWKNQNGEGWVHLAIQGGRFLALRHLLSNGAEVKTFNHQGMTPLELATTSMPQHFLWKTLNKKDEGFTKQIEQCVVLGYRIQLVVQSSIVFRDKIKEANEYRLVDSITLSVHKFSTLSEIPRFSPTRIQSILESLMTAKEKDEKVLLESSKNRWTMVQGGWGNHIVSYLFFTNMREGNEIYNFCVKVDMGGEDFNGLRLYSFHHVESEVHLKAIQKAAKRGLRTSNISMSQAGVYFKSEIDEKLHLRLIGELNFEKGVKNNPWTALKAAFIALLVLDEIETTKCPTSQKNMVSIFTDVAKDFSAWEEWDFNQSLFQLNTLLLQHSNIFNRKATFSQMIQDGLQSGFESRILSLISLDADFANWADSEGKSLLCYAYEQKMNDLVTLLESYANVALEDTEGEGLYTDMIEGTHFNESLLSMEWEQDTFNFSGF